MNDRVFLKNIFYVTSGLEDMPSLKFQLRISFLFYVGLSHNLVKEIWVVHITLRSNKISCEIEGPVDLWSQLQGKCIFFLYCLICQFITQSILDRITPNFHVWSLKAKEKYRGMLRGESSGCSMEISHVLSDWAQICLRKIRLRICIYIWTWYVTIPVKCMHTLSL